MPSLEIIQFLSEKFFNIFKNKRDFLGDKVKTPDIERESMDQWDESIVVLFRGFQDNEMHERRGINLISDFIEDLR